MPPFAALKALTRVCPERLRISLNRGNQNADKLRCYEPRKYWQVRYHYVIGLPNPSPGFTRFTPTGPLWVRYGLALVCSALAIVLEIAFNQFTGQPVYPFLLAFAGIITTAAFAGWGPGIASTTVLVTWAVFDLWKYERTPNSIFWRCLIFAVEGAVLSVGSARLWKAKREAHRGEAWHKRLVETANEGIWIQNDASVITYANARMAEMLGVSVEQLVGRRVDEFFFAADLSVERVRAENLRRGRKEQFDRRMRRSDGSEIWALTCCNLIEADQGEKPGALAMMTDITERKRAEHALRQSEERFRNLFETVLEGVYQSTPDGRILHANPMLLKMLGVQNESQLNDINIAKDLDADPHVRRRLLERLEHEGGFQNVEYELRSRDGRIISVLENARVIRDENGAVLYYEGTLTDITPKKRMEEQLRQAQKAEALGRLAGGIAHDFNNVLTVVTGYAQLVLTELELSHPARQSAEQVVEAAGSAIALTKQLLAFSRRQVPIQGSVDLNRAIERSQPALRLLLNDRASGIHTDLILSLCPEMAPVHASQTQIELTLLSLAACLRNAQPILTLQIRTELVHLDDEVCGRCGGVQSGFYTALSIRGLRGANGDRTGVIGLLRHPGISAMTAGESASLGLSSTHAVVVQRGGFIAGDPGADRERPDAFHVFFPCAMAPADDESGPFESAADGGETILLVEEEPLVRELSRDMLERQGYRVILASDASEAEKISADGAGFDLLITDAVMPNVSGVELARRIRHSNPGIKVLFISGYSDESGESYGGDGAAFLQKPFSADSLGRKIRQILRSANR